MRIVKVCLLFCCVKLKPLKKCFYLWNCNSCQFPLVVALLFSCWWLNGSFSHFHFPLLVPPHWCGSKYDTVNPQSFGRVSCSPTDRSQWGLMGYSCRCTGTMLYLDAEVWDYTFFFFFSILFLPENSNKKNVLCFNDCMNKKKTALIVYFLV